MNTKILAILAVAVPVAGLLAWNEYTTISQSDGMSEPASAGAPGNGMVRVSLPEALSEQAKLGKAAFDAKCAACHGSNASGRDGKGPPLVHKIYEPGHHSDMAFVMAAQNGVRAHHWRFGNMPPVEGVTDADVKAIARYVRELQKENGIF